ncbi:DNA-binding transcriptional LysR family regulator [Microbacterium foliorum]|uniref:DNA-binding transcriptional LysR family regulator n=1 Tax=Microbacterium foliorum TaxID=104336 RepID=A0ABU1HW83_9MICO|nr:LysR substrate-binding domain-containing protein [Microbacterium foliorum]MDR6144072.1 DNA-binding transcriptional LysR family regulator [Microbacterium foliorum]
MALDLDLLRVFVEVFDRGSLTRAAITLRVTQPSVSYSLTRLRRELADPLFIRSAQGMEPTPRALDLYPVARSAIDQIDAVVDRSRFDPATATTRFRLALTDMGESALLPPLLERLSQTAPHIGIDVVPMDADYVERWLLRGEVDAAIASIVPSSRVASTVLFDERYVCVADWPGEARTPLTAAELSALRFAALDSTAGHPGAVTVLPDHGASLDVVLRTAHLSTLPEAIRRGRLAAIVPSRIASGFEQRWGLSMRELPPSFASFQVRLLSNGSDYVSAARRWLLETVTETIGDPR